MFFINKLVKVFKLGFVISMDVLYLGVLFDGKVIDFGCFDLFGFFEVKCLEIKYLVIFLDVCFDSSFFMEEVDGKFKFKCIYKYYV